jgi:hypothetical protein
VTCARFERLAILAIVALALWLNARPSAAETYAFVASWDPVKHHSVVLLQGGHALKAGAPPLTRGVPFSMGDYIRVEAHVIGNANPVGRVEEYEATVSCIRDVHYVPIKRVKFLYNERIKNGGGCRGFIIKFCKDKIIPHYANYWDVEPHYDRGSSTAQRFLPVTVALLDQVYPVLEVQSASLETVALNRREGLVYSAVAPASGVIRFERLWEVPGMFDDADEAHALDPATRAAQENSAQIWAESFLADPVGVGCKTDDNGDPHMALDGLRRIGVTPPQSGYKLEVRITIEGPSAGGKP